MPLIETKGAASAQGFGEFAKIGAANYIEDVFSTWLYTGIGSGTVTINNGIDLTGKGGLVWRKARNLAFAHDLFDTARGNNNALQSNNTNAQDPNYSCVFTSSGFQDATGWATSDNIVSWTFRKQPKFFDVVTYTGNGTARTIAHSLGSVPGCMIIKRTDAARDWAVYHRSSGATKGIYLNSTAAEFTSLTALWNGTTPTSTEFSVGTNGDVNASGGTYVAYLFAHDAGGFGSAGTDNVITCGSFTTGSGSFSVNVGYEPQLVLFKRTDSTGNWITLDNMRGFPAFTSGALSSALFPNTSGAESASNNLSLNSTGFESPPGGYVPSATYIYIAIRRGPMKTPTTGTSVFSPNTSSAGTGTTLTTNFPTDLQMQALRTSAVSDNTSFFDRLRGFSTTPTNETGQRLISSATDAETSPANQTRYFNNTGFQIPSNWGGSSVIYLNFRRAPGFFDVVCYTGNGTSQTVTHNLGVTAEFGILKNRSASTNWPASLNSPVLQGSLNTATAFVSGIPGSAGYFRPGWATNGFYVDQTTFAGQTDVNASGNNYVAYLFASCPGVSKVGTYTGTGALQTINCGFTGGARFVLIKRTDSTGDWWVYDSARGITSGNDPYLFLNTTAAEVTGTNYVDTTSVGFQVTAAAPAGLNANGGTYLFLAIA